MNIEFTKTIQEERKLAEWEKERESQRAKNGG